MSSQRRQPAKKIEDVKRQPVRGPLYAPEDYKEGFRIEQPDDGVADLLPVLALFFGSFALIFKVGLILLSYFSDPVVSNPCMAISCVLRHDHSQC